MAARLHGCGGGGGKADDGKWRKPKHRGSSFINSAQIKSSGSRTVIWIKPELTPFSREKIDRGKDSGGLQQRGRFADETGESNATAFRPAFLKGLRNNVHVKA